MHIPQGTAVKYTTNLSKLAITRQFTPELAHQLEDELQTRDVPIAVAAAQRQPEVLSIGPGPAGATMHHATPRPRAARLRQGSRQPAMLGIPGRGLAKPLVQTGAGLEGELPRGAVGPARPGAGGGFPHLVEVQQVGAAA